MEQAKPSLNQISELTRILKEDKVLQDKYDMEDTYTLIQNITYKQYKYILYLLFNRKRLKLNEILIQLGFKPKKYD